MDRLGMSIHTVYAMKRKIFCVSMAEGFIRSVDALCTMGGGYYLNIKLHSQLQQVREYVSHHGVVKAVLNLVYKKHSTPGRFHSNCH